MGEWRRTHRWGELTRSEIAEARDAGALPVLALGAVEQHGDHLPVDTDAFSAYEVSLPAAARCTKTHALLLPPQNFGFSPHHETWPGTVSLSSQTLTALIEDIAKSLHRTGFRRMLVVNGHGGNEGPALSACNTLICRGISVGFVNYFNPSRREWLEVLPGKHRDLGHACAYETSMQLALRPEERARIVKRIANLPPRLTPPFSNDPAIASLRDAGLTWAWLFGPGDVGYYGDPASTDPDISKQILERTVTALSSPKNSWTAGGCGSSP